MISDSSARLLSAFRSTRLMKSSMSVNGAAFVARRDDAFGRAGPTFFTVAEAEHDRGIESAVAIHRSAARSLTPLRLMSGGSTAMPRRTHSATASAMRSWAPALAEHGGHVLVRVVRLQVRGLVRDGAVAGGVRLVEGVAGERLDQVEDRRALPLRCSRSSIGAAMNFSPSACISAAIFFDIALRIASAVLQRVAGELLHDHAAPGPGRR